MPTRFKIEDGSGAALRIARALLEAEAADPVDWGSGNVLRFIERTVDRWQREEMTPLAERAWPWVVSVVDKTDNWLDGGYSGNETDDDFLILAGPRQAHAIAVGATLEFLEAQHKRLAVTWYDLLTSSLSRVMSLYDWTCVERDLDYIVELELDDDYVDGTRQPSPEPYERRFNERVEQRRSQIVPREVRGRRGGKTRALGSEYLETLLMRSDRKWTGGLEDSRATALLRGVIALKEAADAVVLPKLDESYFDTWAGTYPALLVTRTQNDEIAGAFDEAMDMWAQGGEPIGPSLVLPLKLADPEGIRSAKSAFRGVCKVMRLAAEHFELLITVSPARRRKHQGKALAEVLV